MDCHHRHKEHAHVHGPNCGTSRFRMAATRHICTTDTCMWVTRITTTALPSKSRHLIPMRARRSIHAKATKRNTSMALIADMSRSRTAVMSTIWLMGICTIPTTTIAMTMGTLPLK
jgi:hypothetical protein